MSVPVRWADVNARKAAIPLGPAPMIATLLFSLFDIFYLSNPRISLRDVAVKSVWISVGVTLRVEPVRAADPHQRSSISARVSNAGMVDISPVYTDLFRPVGVENRAGAGGRLPLAA
ncbi:hypothetical protein [Gordonia shandongensis]|uniref:hypothetical protein n=1 Tax=Gordonia shandongensis TaxID=376351 RepID=UPI00146A9B63|nr:hypothetical protein [Gordonia shandongensis]